MELLFKHTWILFIAVTTFNGFMIKHKSKKYSIENPDLQEGYDALFKGYLFFLNIPWIIIAIGNLSGLTDSFFEYFSPQLMNPIVLVFHATLIILWLLGIWWIYFNNGAEFIEKHPGLVTVTSFKGKVNVTAKLIKLLFPIMILGGVFAMIMMWNIEFPTQLFKQ